MKIRLNENKLKQIVNESVKKVLKEGSSRCPDKYFGGYFFEGLGRDINGNPIYCSEHLPLEAKKMLGWRKSAKYGMRGQADSWGVCHVLDELGLPRGNDEEEYYNSLDESRVKKTPKSINIDGVDYEKTDVKGGGMLHPGFRWKDHETHNPEKSKQFRKRKDGYRYTQSYDGSPRWIHNQLTTESSYDSNGNFNAESHNSELREKLTQEVIGLRKYLDKKLDTLNYIATSATDDRIKTRARAIMYGDIMSSNEDAKRTYQLIKANRWDID